MEAKFIQWMRDNGCFVHEALNFNRAEHLDRGVISTEDLKNETLLFTMTDAILIEKKNPHCILHPAIASREIARFKLSDWELLIVIMMVEYAATERSHFAPYLALLPTPEELDTMLYFSDAEMKALVGTSSLDRIGANEIAKTYRKKYVV